MKNLRLEAEAIQEVIRPKDNTVVGWLYQWNTGEKAVLWLEGPCDVIEYRELVQEPPPR